MEGREIVPGPTRQDTLHRLAHHFKECLCAQLFGHLAGECASVSHNRTHHLPHYTAMQPSPLQKRKEREIDSLMPDAAKESRREATLSLDRLPPEILIRILQLLRLQVRRTLSIKDVLSSLCIFRRYSNCNKLTSCVRMCFV